MTKQQEGQAAFQPEEVILVKLGEIVLKGLNRGRFENTLMKNISRRLEPLGNFSIRSAQSTVYIEPLDAEADFEAAVEQVSRIFGVIAYTRARVTEKSMESILREAGAYLGGALRRARTFKVESKRSDKRFPKTSPEISAAVGEAVLNQYPHLAVDVHQPDVTVRVEVREVAAYIHGDALPGAGGIPVGTGGRAAVLISGGIDSPVAAWMMAKRGVELTAVHFASPPYTSLRAEEKVCRLLERVSAYAGRLYMVTAPFSHIQEEIRGRCPEEYFTLIMRRFMMRIARRIAQQQNCSALVTGESLGQVASQTIQAIACTDAVAGMPVFRPLIGMDKSEIVLASRKIDAFDISIEPYEDCCTVFTPRHPTTRPELAKVEEAESVLDIDALVEESVRGIYTRKITPGQTEFDFA